MFFYAKMIICHSRNLRQMGNTQDLPLFPQQTHFFPNLSGSLTANTCVDFVKNKGSNFVCIHQHCFQCQHHAGHFPAGCDFCQRLQVLPRVGRNQKFHFIQTVCGKIFPFFYGNIESCLCHFHIMQCLFHLCLHLQSCIFPNSCDFSS